VAMMMCGAVREEPAAVTVRLSAKFARPRMSVMPRFGEIALVDAVQPQNVSVTLLVEQCPVVRPAESANS
jgi:hypothetical protein